MEPAIDQPADRGDGHDVPEPGYAAWKRRKIERGLAESRVGDAMIPVEQLWRDLKLER